jgi:hypothetical protein
MSESCYTVALPIYQLSMRVITSITTANPAVVTTSIPHQYITGAIVRFYITPNHGMPQLNQQTGEITLISPTTFSVAIDTSNYAPFVIPSLAKYTCSQVVPIGENNSILTAATRNVLPYGTSYTP